MRQRKDGMLRSSQSLCSMTMSIAAHSLPSKYAYTHAHMYTHTNTHAHTHTCMQICARTHAHTHTYTHAHEHTYTQNTHTYTHLEILKIAHSWCTRENPGKMTEGELVPLATLVLS